MPTIIDFHTHAFPDSLAPRAIAQLTINAAASGSNAGPYPSSSKVRCLIYPFAEYIIFEKCIWKRCILSKPSSPIKYSNLSL